MARFRDELLAAAEGARAAIARARVRRVDAVVGGRDLTLATAEAIQALAPFRARQPARPARDPGRRARVARAGGTRASTCRSAPLLRGPTRAGRRLPHGQAGVGLDLDERHDAVVTLDVERWQGLVGPHVTVEALEELAPRDPLPAQCPQPCDAACPDRLPLARLRTMLGDPWRRRRRPEGEPAPPTGVRDRRGECAALPVLAALAEADRGVVAVVSDVARRRAAFATALEPGRLGAEVAVLARPAASPAPCSPASTVPAASRRW